MEKSNLILRSVLIKEANAYSAICLDTDVASDGETAEQAKASLQEAVELYIESAVENNLPVIRPIPKEDNPLFARASDVVEEFVLNVNFKITTYV
ncbi:MAG: type II toxin-antitoxin system HicB family antitoxin [Bacteroidetes bacterium]|nr:type II toxin-antitoxin system HicB family antitoxin [Bacteroidota bacterium]